MILERIAQQRRESLRALIGTEAEERVRAEACAVCVPSQDLATALTTLPGVSIIAEVKRRSPSAGDIRPDLQPAALARAYVSGGAAAVSVITEPDHFAGSIADLIEVRRALTGESRLPVLLKDFILTPYQVYQARAAGADAVLLIAACLTDEELESLYGLATGLGMSALVEIHDEAELDRVAALRPKVIGINNRDLRTFGVDLTTTIRLGPRAARLGVVVSESGIKSPDDVRTVARAGADAVLVGESLVRSHDVVQTLRCLREA
ncbi:MAG: indole-3-glycerol phosphate synthase TrpC [Anaerolineae bacterium]|nr:indole-3-glycerol phosphate synthase TrpC [Anaerolineae bacterium]